MAWTQTDLDALDAEIKMVQTVSSASYSDQQNQFRPIEELLKLRSTMAAAIAAEAAAASGSGSTRYVATKKGV